MKTDKLIRKENFDRYEFDSIVAWEKKITTKRFNNLQDQEQIEKRTRSSNSKNADIDIIR